MVTGKCYQSNKRSYHQIRYQSDKLCKENSLSVIDEYYERFKKKYKTSGKSWYENEQVKNGTSWKSKLQFDIDRMIKQSKDWDEFLKRMADLGYEIKYFPAEEVFVSLISFLTGSARTAHSRRGVRGYEHTERKESARGETHKPYAFNEIGRAHV